MSEKPKEVLSGGIYPNDRKETENQPDYTGPCSTPDGKKLRFAAWKAKDKNGKSYLSFKISEPMRCASKGRVACSDSVKRAARATIPAAACLLNAYTLAIKASFCVGDNARDARLRLKRWRADVPG